MKAIDLHQWIEQAAPPHTPADKVDGIMAGDPDAEISGVAVTWLPNLDVLKRSAAAGLNFIIAHEPTKGIALKSSNFNPSATLLFTGREPMLVSPKKESGVTFSRYSTNLG